ncbi:hypothetical protein CEP52_007297 [Fusarium oligoseptatum]|uniref:Small ribosomal subunit protein mS23 n=1 Tax=Fusarium oligoseptatum TaxID=2604345 RepID=A0A428TNH2_9HYPO|nr:hypothetical protein CEP52_007297 [Fusarium oligoseptatum]
MPASRIIGVKIGRSPKFPPPHHHAEHRAATSQPTPVVERQLTLSKLAMGGRQIRPARVFQTVTEELNHSLLGQKSNARPPWYTIMQTVPPSETLVRTIPPRHRTPNPRATKPKNIFRPQRIRYLEDSLRTTFYKDHPWELARPRIIMELDGKDYQHSENVSFNARCGSCRTKNVSERKAYDITRREFYRLRQEEEIEKRVAVEEARHVGAYFGKTRIDVSHSLEDREFENWKLWAGKETERSEAQRNAEIESFGLEEEGADGDDIAIEVDAAEADNKVGI